jgi:hypothetical protein
MSASVDVALFRERATGAELTEATRRVRSLIDGRPDQIHDLPFDDVVSLVDFLPKFLLAQADQAQGVADRRQGVAKFMAEHRQEFILAAVVIGQRRRLLLRLAFQTPAFGDSRMWH